MRITQQIIGMARLLEGTDYKYAIGVFEQYLHFVHTTITSEGKQAVTRLKAYRDKVMKNVATGDFNIPKNKYRQLKPINRLAQEMCKTGDHKYLFIIFTVLRSYDLYFPSEKQMMKEYEEFKKEYLSDRLETFRPSEFPIGDFRDYLSVIKEDLRKFIKLSRPLESAKLMAKKGTVRLKDKQIKAPSSRFLPSIIGAPYEMSKIDKKYPRYRDEVLIPMMDDLARPFGLKGSWPKSLGSVDNSRYDVHLRRNCYFGAGGYKTRIIGIADYATQYALSPIHDTLMDALRRLPCDYTRDHNEGFKAISSYSARDDAYVCCYDLSAATDRFPVTIQLEVLSTIFGSDIAKRWFIAMVGLSFDGLYYKYGQPMGMLSSWAAFSFTHHIMVSFAVHRTLGPAVSPHRIQDDYGIIGDDIFICEPKVAVEYSKLMSALGVKINMAKSLTLDSHRGVSEFCKRNSYRGTEISGISPRLVSQAYNNDYPSLQSLIRLLVSRFPHYCYDDFVSDVLSKSNPKMRLWIKTNLGVPYDIGGLWSLSSQRPIASPEYLLPAIATYAIATSKYAYRGPLVDRDGKIITDELNYWESKLSDPIIDINDKPFVLYQREYGEDIRTKSETLLGKLLNYYDQMSDLPTSSSIINSHTYSQFLKSVKELDAEFYQQSELRSLILKDYIHKYFRIKDKIDKGKDIRSRFKSNRIDYKSYEALFASVEVSSGQDDSPCQTISSDIGTKCNSKEHEHIEFEESHRFS